PVKIGITCYPTVGGSGAVAAELGKQLARRGHSVHFVSYRLPFRLDEFQENVRYHEVDLTTYSLFEYPPHDLALAAKMAEVGREGPTTAPPSPLPGTRSCSTSPPSVPSSACSTWCGSSPAGAARCRPCS